MADQDSEELQLEEVLGFLRHGNSEIRKMALEQLPAWSTEHPAAFKIKQLEPVKDLKLLVRDYEQNANYALTILVNLSEDQQVLKELAEDDAFLETLLLKITKENEANANEVSMLLANMSKSDSMLRILELKRSVPTRLSTSEFAMDQLMDCFVKGADGSFNKNADFDYLSYFFADLSKFPECRAYFTTAQSHDNQIVPLTKLTVFTEHKSTVRRRGVAATIKNVAFDTDSHDRLFLDSGANAINIFPYVLLPLMGPEEYSEEDTDGMLPELQLLEPDKTREPDLEIIKTHLDTLMLLTATREGRDRLRATKVYPIVREAHLKIEDEEVREAINRLVQVVMRDEEDHEPNQGQPRVQEDDEDDKVVDVF